MELAIITTCGVATTILLLAGVHDLAFRTVPNWMPVALLLPSILLRLMSGSLMLGLLAGLLVFLGGAFCWRRGWLGGGDVKLLAATAVLVPPSLVVNLLLDVALAGGVLGDDLSRDGSVGSAAIHCAAPPRDAPADPPHGALPGPPPGSAALRLGHSCRHAFHPVQGIAP